MYWQYVSVHICSVQLLQKQPLQLQQSRSASANCLDRETRSWVAAARWRCRAMRKTWTCLARCSVESKPVGVDLCRHRLAPVAAATIVDVVVSAKYRFSRGWHLNLASVRTIQSAGRLPTACFISRSCVCWSFTSNFTPPHVDQRRAYNYASQKTDQLHDCRILQRYSLGHAAVIFVLSNRLLIML